MICSYDLKFCNAALSILGYTEEEIGKLCPHNFWNGQECLSNPFAFEGSDECSGAVACVVLLTSNGHGGLWSDEAVEVCNNLELCQETLPALGYTDEEIEKLCYPKNLNWTECFLEVNEGMRDCRGFVTDEKLEIQGYTLDCSDVEPCAVGECHTQPFEFTTPDEIYPYYPQCSSSVSGSSYSLFFSGQLHWLLRLLLALPFYFGS